jgi:hypothetical protein
MALRKHKDNQQNPEQWEEPKHREEERDNPSDNGSFEGIPCNKCRNGGSNNGCLCRNVKEETGKIAGSLFVFHTFTIVPGTMRRKVG